MKSEIERRRHRRAVKMLGRLVFTTLGPLTLSLFVACSFFPSTRGHNQCIRHTGYTRR
jgi:hypothetical protein